MLKLNFLIVWIGQVISIFGSNLSSFALGVWLYQKTGSASYFALVALCTALPHILLSPLAGVLVDHYNRRWMMAISDTGSAVCTLGLATLFFSGQIQVWHILLATAISASFSCLQTPAFSALVASNVPRNELGRANGLIQFGRALSDILAPLAAAWLIAMVRLSGVLMIDLATFCFAILALALARFPGRETGRSRFDRTTHHKPSWLSELRAGLHLLSADRGLLNLLRYQALFAFLWSLFGVLVTPMILGFTNAEGLGTTLTIAGVGLLTGSLMMTAWGGPKRRLSGLLVFELASAAGFCLMGLQPNLILAASAAFLAHWALAFVSSLTEAIWQSQVSPEMQGRIFACKQAIMKASTLGAYLLAGGLADRFLEPMLSVGGPLASSFGRWFGAGPGRGIAVLFILIGLVKAISVAWLFLNPEVRKLDNRLCESPSSARHETAAQVSDLNL